MILSCLQELQHPSVAIFIWLLDHPFSCCCCCCSPGSAGLLPLLKLAVVDFQASLLQQRQPVTGQESHHHGADTLNQGQLLL
jgi:hypothetical protein